MIASPGAASGRVTIGDPQLPQNFRCEVVPVVSVVVWKLAGVAPDNVRLSRGTATTSEEVDPV
jgi:hypothetical protein